MPNDNKFMPDFTIDDEFSASNDQEPETVADNPFMPKFDDPVQGIPFPNLRHSVNQALNADPDQAARARRASGRSGVPLAVTERNLDEVERKARAREIEFLAEISPHTARFLSNPDHAKLAHDDAENLSAMESLLKYGKNALKRGGIRAELNVNQFVGDQSAEQATDTERTFGQILTNEQGPGSVIPNPLDLLMAGERFMSSRLFDGADEAAKARMLNVGKLNKRIADTPMSPAATAARDAISKAGKGGLVSAIDAALSDPAGSMALAAEVGGEFLPQIAVGSLATVATRNPMAGAAVMGGLSGATERYSSPSEFLSKRGFDLTNEKAVEKVLNDPDLMREAAEHGYTRGMIIGSIDALSGGLASKMLFKGPMTNMLTQLGVQSTLGGTGEALAQYVTEDEIDWGEVVMEAIGEFATTPIEVIGVGGAYLKDASKTRKARVDQETIDEGAALAKASKLRERAPDKFREHLEEAAPDQTVFVSTDALAELFQSTPEAGTVLAEAIPEFEARLLEAQAADGFLEMPYADYSTHLASLEQHDALIRENVKFGFDDFTTSEAQAFEGEIDEIIQTELNEQERTADETKGVETAAERAGDHIQEQLIRAGRSSSVAQNEAALHRAFAKVLQERYGLAADEVDGLYGGLSVKGQLSESVRKIPVDQMDLLLDRIRKGGRSDKDTLGKSLVEFVRELGINDDRGDLAAMDIDKELPAFAKRALREDGLSLDDLALAAQEAGFFPDMQISEGDRVDIDTLIDAISNELAGSPLYQEGAVDQAELDRQEAAAELERELERRGIDTDADNATIKAALEEQELDAEAELFQGGEKSKPVAVLAGNEIDLSGDTYKARRAAASEWYKKNLQGTKIESEIGTVRFTGKGRKKAISSNPDVDTLRLFPAINSIISDGTYAGSLPTSKDRKDLIVRFHRFEADVMLDGQTVRAAVLVAEDENGKLFYDLFKEKPLLGNSEIKARAPKGSTDDGSSLKQSIANSGDDFNLTILNPSNESGVSLEEQQLDPESELFQSGPVHQGSGRRKGAKDRPQDVSAGPDGKTDLFENDASFWKNGIDKALLDGKLKRPLTVLRKSAVLENLGEGGKLALQPGAFLGVSNKHPDIPSHVWERLPELVADPLYAFPHPDGGVNVILDTRAASGSFIAVGVRDGDIRTVTTMDGDPETRLSSDDRVYRNVAVAVDAGKKIYAKDNAAADEVLRKSEATKGLIPFLPTAQSGQSSQPARPRVKGSIVLRDDIVQNSDGALFYQPDGGGSRGSIQFFPDNQTIINLGEAADLSTFVHESGHWFVNTLEKIAPHNEEAQQDLTAMMKFVGAKDAGEFAKVENQETLARAFESYLRSGKAPSADLQPAFRRFKSWLVSIYRDLAGLNVELTPEIRQVFDRMLATDAEIEAAESFNRYTLDRGLADLLTTSERKQVQEAAQNASDTAKERLLARKIAENEREATQAWKAELATVKETVRKDINDRPVYRAIDMLRDRKLGLKLDRADVADLLGDEVLARLPKGLVRADGLAADALADMVGTSSGQRLIEDLLNAAPNKKTRDALINDEAERVMKERHGSLDDNQRQAAEAANEIVLSEDRAKFIALELRLLKEHAGDTLRNAAARDIADTGAASPQDDRDAVEGAAERTAASEGATDAVVNEAFERSRATESVTGRRAQGAGARQARSALNVSPAAIREVAKQVIARNTVNDAVKVGRYATASQKAAKDAALAIARRDYDAAARHKRTQLLNHYLAGEAIKAKAEVEKTRKYLTQFSNHRKKFKGVDADYIDKIRTIVDAYQLGSRLSDRKRTVLELRAINQWMVEQAEDEGALLNIPPEILAADEKAHYRDLSLDDFRALNDTVKNIEAQGRLKKKLLNGKDEIDLQAAVDEITGAMDALPTSGRAIRRAKEQNPGNGDKILGGLASADAALSKVEFILEALDGVKNGPFHRMLFQPFADAGARSADMTKAITKTVMDAIDGLPKDARKRLSQKIDVPSMGRTFMRSDLIMMALNTGNESNLSKMIEGSAKDIAPGSVAWTEQSVNEALDNLTQPEWALVQLVWDSFEGMYPEVEAIHRREYGVSPERVEARTVKTRHGEFRGGYFPMAYDPERSAQARDIEAKSALEAMQSESVKASVNSSMTKGRTGFSAPVSLRLDMLPNHIQNTVHFVTHYEAVRSSRKLLANKDIREAVTNKMGNEYYDGLKDWLGAVASNGRDQVKTGPLGKLFEGLRTNVTIGILGFSYTTMAAQLLGYTNSVDALSRNDDGTYTPGKGAKWLMGGLTQYAAHPGKVTKQVFDKSGEMRHRLENTDRDLRHSMNKLAGKKGAWKQMQRFSLMAIGGIQLYGVDLPVWVGSYNKALSEGMSDADAVNRADSIVRTSQTAGGVKDLAAIQREPGVTKALTMFYSYFNLLYNIEKQAVGETKAARDIPRLASRAALLLVIPAAVDELVRQRGPDDDEGIAEWLAMKSTVYAFSSIVFLRDLVGGLSSGFGFKLSPIEGLGNAIGGTMNAIAKAFDDDEPVDTAAMKAVLTFIGFVRGVPVQPVKRVIDAVDAMDRGFDVGPYDFLTGHPDN